MEAPFFALDGVIDVIPGYMGGHVVFPTYEQVCTGETGHYEVVRVTYNPEQVTYEELLQVFWNKIDPTDDFGQLMDRGPQYRTAVFFSNDEEGAAARTSKNALMASGRYQRRIATEILAVTRFYEAEEYHHHYYEKMKKRFSSVNFY